jgi:serine/threonine protein kinase
VALSVGTRLGHFEVLAPLGAGGMGEVYRARDTRLERDVALKVLPEAFSRDSERLARFEREARVLATLSHRGIAAIHGIEDHGGLPVLVMELVEGETLAHRLERGRLPIRQALDVGRQIAEALGAAHEKGIIHRDLKPSNIKLTVDGRIKLLDFGLAKALESTDSREAGTSVSTTDSTSTGVLIGTPPYMSPEQARGETLDRRTDIWAFGCVLYELLTGARAFPGHTPEAIAAVLEREPEWQSLPPDAPYRVQQLIRRCLQKERTRRLHDVEDARIELEEALSELSTAYAVRTGPIASRRGRHLFIGALAALALLVSTFGGFLLARHTIPARIPTYRQITFRRGIASSGRFTPDGKTVVYSASWDGGLPEIYSVRTDAPESKSLGLPPGHVVAVSSKGELAMLLTQHPVYFNPAATLARQ